MKSLRKRIVMVVALFCVGVMGSVPGVSIARAGDAWMVKVALSELDRVADSGEFDVLSARVKGAILGRLSTGKLKSLTEMHDLIYVLRACKYGKLAAELEFERTEAEAKIAAKGGMFKDGNELFKWLIANRELSRLLFRAMQDVSEPVESLKAVAQLKSVGDKKLLAFGELVAAFATSRASQCYHEQPNPASLVESFEYYTTKKMRYDMKTMPYELSRYLTDTNLSIKERLWAYGRYGRHPNPAKIFFELKYDIAHMAKGEPKKISKLEFTLPNLRKAGGVSIEQAYYSTEICKALGIPAKIVTGKDAAGDGQYSWVMCLVRGVRRSRFPTWDSTTGRHPQLKYYVGDVQNPANGKDIFDCEMMLNGAMLSLSPTKRQDADTAMALAVLAAEVANAGKLGDLTELQALLTLHRKRFGTYPIPSDSLKATIVIDMDMVEGFITTAINNNLVHKAAWDFIIELRQNRDMLGSSNIGKYIDVLMSKTSKIYPDYSCEMILRFVPSLPELTARMKAYQKAMKTFASNPYLVGRIMIACGDDYAKQEKPAKALKLYEMVAMKNIILTSIVADASGKAEKLLTDAGHIKAAIKMYTKLFKRAQKLKKTAGVLNVKTSYHIAGARLAALLETDGQAKTAQKVRA
ncbi:MAG: transglutaminase domain-containing protein, partial [bacterium]|nr:transglutaminase domain-containing protein [bacterium]